MSTDAKNSQKKHKKHNMRGQYANQIHSTTANKQNSMIEPLEQAKEDDSRQSRNNNRHKRNNIKHTEPVSQTNYSDVFNRFATTGVPINIRVRQNQFRAIPEEKTYAQKFATLPSPLRPTTKHKVDKRTKINIMDITDINNIDTVNTEAEIKQFNMQVFQHCQKLIEQATTPSKDSHHNITLQQQKQTWITDCLKPLFADSEAEELGKSQHSPLRHQPLMCIKDKLLLLAKVPPHDNTNPTEQLALPEDVHNMPYNECVKVFKNASKQITDLPTLRNMASQAYVLCVCHHDSPKLTKDMLNKIQKIQRLMPNSSVKELRDAIDKCCETFMNADRQPVLHNTTMPTGNNNKGNNISNYHNSSNNIDRTRMTSQSNNESREDKPGWLSELLDGFCSLFTICGTNADTVYDVDLDLRQTGVSQENKRDK